MPKPAISLVIPTYNRQEQLRRALESVRLGTLQPNAIIVVDDGSTDNTVSYLAQLPHVLTIAHPVNLGVSAARNSGIRVAKTPWIVLLDSDDWWLPNHLECISRHIATHSDCQIVQTRERWYRGGRRVNPKARHIPPAGEIFEASLELCLISSSAVAFKKALYETVGGYDERMPACEDYDLWLRMTRLCHVDLIDIETIEKEGGQADQLSRRFWGMDRFRVYAMVKLLASGTLTRAQAIATRQVCRKKLAILCAGAEKRGNESAVLGYRAWLEAVICEQERGFFGVGVSDPIYSVLLP